MVEAKLRVETLERRDNDNPFFGNTLAKNVVEETLCNDKDYRENIAPSGIKATLKVVGNTLMDITINRYHLGYHYTDGLSLYTSHFSIFSRIYEVSVWFDGGELQSATISEWYNDGDFLEDLNPDNVYRSEDFETFESYLS